MKYQIIVSEPWDFEGPDGINIIIGEIVEIISPIYAVFISDYLLNFDDNTGDILFLEARFKNESLKNGVYFEGEIGGSLLLEKEYEGKSVEYLEANSKYVLIGTLERC